MKISFLFSILIVLGVFCLHGATSQPIFKIFKKKFRKFVKPAKPSHHRPVQPALHIPQTSYVVKPLTSYQTYVPVPSYGGHHHHG